MNDRGPGVPEDGARPPRAPRGTVGRMVVVLVLLAFLAGGIVLELRAPEVTSTRLTAIGTDGPVVPPADAVSTAWYCAAGTSDVGGAADETVYVANLSPDDIAATVTVDPGVGETARTRRLELAAYERGRVRVGDILAVASPGIVVEVLGGPAIVEHEVRGDADVAMSPCAQEPARAWYFAAGSTARGSTQTLELFNPFGDDAIVDISFLTEGGVQEPQALQGFVVGRRSKVQVVVEDIVLRQDRVATLVRARTGRVVAEQVRAFDGTEATEGVARRAGLTMTLGVSGPRRLWTLPVATAGAGTSGTVSIANFGLAPAEVEVSILLSGEGVLAPESVDVPSRSVVLFDPSARVPAGTSYAVVVRALGNTPVVAEAFVAAAGVATATGASSASRRWALAGSPARASSAVLAVNRSNRPLTVELRAHTEGDANSPRSAPAQVVAPGKVARFDLDEWGIEPEQVLVVSADGPIVVAREVYAGGVSLAVGVPFRGR